MRERVKWRGGGRCCAHRWCALWRPRRRGGWGLAAQLQPTWAAWLQCRTDPMLGPCVLDGRHASVARGSWRVQSLCSLWHRRHLWPARMASILARSLVAGRRPGAALAGAQRRKLCGGPTGKSARGAQTRAEGATRRLVSKHASMQCGAKTHHECARCPDNAYGKSARAPLIGPRLLIRTTWVRSHSAISGGL